MKPVQQRDFDLYSQFQLDDRVVLSNPTSGQQSTTSHITDDGTLTQSYYGAWNQYGTYHPLHYCLREENTPPLFVQFPLNTGNGLYGRYIDWKGYSQSWSNIFNNAPTRLTRLDEYTDMNVFFGYTRPSGVPGITDDYFAIEWTGYFQSNSAGTYTWFLMSDNPSRIFINGSVVANSGPLYEWGSGSKYLAANTIHTFKMQYYEQHTLAHVYMEWQGPGISRRKPWIGRYYTSDPSLPPADEFIANGASTSNPLITTRFPGLYFVEKVQVYPYAGKGYPTNGVVQISTNGIDWETVGNYYGKTKTSTSQFDEIRIDRNASFVRLKATSVTSSRMELKLIKIYKDPKITLDSDSLTSKIYDPEINSDNFDPAEVKTNGAIALEENSAVLSTDLLARDYSEPTGNDPTGLHVVELNGKYINVTPTDVTNESVLSSVVGNGQILKSFNLNQARISSGSIPSLASVDVDPNAGDAALKITGKIKIETEDDYLFWPRGSDSVQLKISGNTEVSRYGDCLQHWSESSATEKIDLEWADNLNTIHSLDSGQRQYTTHMCDAVPSPFVKGEWLTYWMRYYNPEVDGYPNRWYSILVRKTKDFKTFYEKRWCLTTTGVRSEPTWYDNDQQNPYHVYWGQVYWIKGVKKFIMFFNTHNSTTTEPGSSGWNISSAESEDGIVWTKPKLVVPNSASVQHLYTRKIALGNFNNKWFLLFNKVDGTSPNGQYTIAQSETENLFSDYNSWSAPITVIPHDDTAQLALHSNGCRMVGLIPDYSLQKKYRIIYEIGSGSDDTDRIWEYRSHAIVDDGIAFINKEMVSEDNFVVVPPNLTRKNINVPKTLGNANRISLENDFEKDGWTDSVSAYKGIDYGEYEGKVIYPFAVYSAVDKDGWYDKVGHGAAILQPSTWNDFENCDLVWNLHTPLIYNADIEVYPTQIEKDGDEYIIHASMDYNNTYDVSPKYKVRDYIIKSKDFTNIYDQEMFATGYLHRPLSGEADITDPSYGFDSYRICNVKIVRKGSEYHMFYFGRKDESVTDSIFHSLSTDGGVTWQWAAEIMNTSTHSQFSQGFSGFSSTFYWDDDDLCWYAVVSSRSTVSTGYSFLLTTMKNSSDPHDSGSWTNFTVLDKPSELRHLATPIIKKFNGIFHLYAAGANISGDSYDYWNKFWHAYSFDFITWYGLSNTSTYTNASVIYGGSNNQYYPAMFHGQNGEFKTVLCESLGGEYKPKYFPQVVDPSLLCKVHLTPGLYDFEIIQCQSKKKDSFDKDLFLECKWSKAGKNFSFLTLHQEKWSSSFPYESSNDFVNIDWQVDASNSWYTEATSSNRSDKDAFPINGIIYSDEDYLYIYDSKFKETWMRFIINKTNSLSYFRAPIKSISYINGLMYTTSDYTNSEIRVSDFINEEMRLLRIFKSNEEYKYNNSSAIVNRNSNSGYSAQTSGNQKYYGYVTQSSAIPSFINMIRVEKLEMFRNNANKKYNVYVSSGVNSGTLGSNACLNGDYSTEGYTYHADGNNIILNLGNSVKIKEIFIHWWNGDSRTYNGYTIEYSNDASSYYMLVDRSSESGFQNLTIDTLTEEIACRYIRFTGTGNTSNTSTHVCQFDFFPEIPMISQILLICHKEGITYLNETNNNYKHIIARDDLNNILECKKAKIINGTVYTWFTDAKNRIDKIFVKDNFSTDIDKGYSWDSELEKYVFDISSDNEILIHKEDLIDFDVWYDGNDSYMIFTDKKDGVYKLKDDRNNPTTSNLELLQ